MVVEVSRPGAAAGDSAVLTAGDGDAGTATATLA